MSNLVKVARVGDLSDPGKELVDADGQMLVLFLIGGKYYALDDVCTHDGGPLSDGALCDFAIACPRHGAKFDVRTGAALTMPARKPTRAYEVVVENDDVFVRLPD